MSKPEYKLFEKYPIEYLLTNPLNIGISCKETDVGEITSISRKVHAEFVNKFETFLIDKIVMEAQAMGVTDLYLIDRDFVKSAFEHEMAYRNGSMTFGDYIEVWVKGYEAGRTKGAKELVDRIKDRSFPDETCGFYVIDIEEVDNLLKKFLEEDE